METQQIEKVIKRSSIKNEYFQEIFEAEKHHKHQIIEDEHGTLRWKANKDVRYLTSEKISLNDLCPLLCILGYDKNSEIYRKLYRDMGYSLNGYWEVFYWPVNNPKARYYKGPK